jgi:hypothetical protein
MAGSRAQCLSILRQAFPMWWQRCPSAVTGVSPTPKQSWWKENIYFPVVVGKVSGLNLTGPVWVLG